MGNSKTNKHLKKTQLKELNEKVTAEIARIQTKLSINSSMLKVKDGTSGDEVDSANEELIRRSELRFSTRESLYLKKLQKTQDLMLSDEYGMCEECGSEISFTRLKARPTSTMCITCKEESEREELQSFHGRKSKSYSSSMSV
ncbi:MAG: TraR/DksA family transcriptional regulator [Bacteriovoracaceae bacterium]|nr:TraR/DksA family transcriptional regulator [Bacteriovoracaceae bacterium]